MSARNVTSGARGPAPEWPAHPVGAKRWTYIGAFRQKGYDGEWELCEVVDCYGEFGGRFGDHPELYDVRRPNGQVSSGHFPSSLRDQRPA